MGSFFKIFFASLLALIIFSIIAVFLMLGLISGLTSRDEVKTGARAVLVVDLSKPYMEIMAKNPLAKLGGKEQYDDPSLYDAIRLIRKAKEDSAIKGIYIKCNTNVNGFGTSHELRNAIEDFKSAKKFVYAYGDVISQSAYYVSNVADKIYCNPRGGMEWKGFAMQMVYLKGTLDKLDIQPQIFYAGKFKSATEPFRETKMTEPNRIQTTEILEDLYSNFLLKTSESRKVDTAELRQLANSSAIQFPADALKYKLIDGLKYDDEVKTEIKKRLSVSESENVNFISLGKYSEAVSFKKRGSDKLAVIYAQGDIIDGKSEQGQIGGETYRTLIRNARMDNSIKGIVFRINSGGGSALASENIWRELELAKKSKPVVVSFGDVAASGGYYIACGADSIFAQPNTITGSIGVFTLLPNMEKFFNNKLGVTFDVVKTAPDADLGTIAKPLSETQKKFIQNDVDSIYHTFKSRVAAGRKIDINYVDSIAQGRIWSGSKGISLKLVDRIGGVQDAIDCVARMAKTKEYLLREYPEPQGPFDFLMGKNEESAKEKIIKNEIGEQGMKVYNSIKKLNAIIGTTQAKIPFDFSIN